MLSHLFTVGCLCLQALVNGNEKHMNYGKKTQSSGVSAETLMVLGQMDESAGVRFRVGLSALTYAEYFRDTMQK